MLQDPCKQGNWHVEDMLFEQAVDEIMALYQAIVRYHQADPEEYKILSKMHGQMMDRAMDLFLYDIDSFTVDRASIVLRRTRLTDDDKAEMAQAGLVPYNLPVTREELLAETPGMIPLLLNRVVSGRYFHNMPVRHQLMGPSRLRYCQHYARHSVSV